MKNLKSVFMALFMLCAFAISAQVVYTEPPMIQQTTKNFKVYFDASQGTAGLKGYTGDVYAHTGVITNNSSSSSDWKYAPTWGDNSEKYKLTREATNLYSLTISDINEYYGVEASEVVERLAFVFRSSDNSLEGKETGGKDIFVDVHEAGLAVALTTTSANVFTVANNKVTFTVYSTEDATISLYLNDTNSTPIATGTGTKLTKEYTFAQGDYKVIATATAGGVTKTDEIDMCCRIDSKAVTYSGTLLNGANANADGSVTFTLYAPQKSNVMLVGEWNDYKLTNTQMMNYQGNKYFWLTLPAGTIDLNKEYAYFFLVDDEIEVGDPYAKLVLDPWNDKWINEHYDVYPNLKEFPEKASGNSIISVFYAKADEYNWEVTNFDAPKKDDLLIYELLFRDFTEEGTVAAAIEKLDYLKDLGVNAVELMPIQEFSGNNSWGYNPNFYFAPDKAYGTRDMYKKFIDECHKRGMAVILDVVFNHADNHPWCTLYWNANASPYAKPASNNPFFNVDAPHNWSVFNDWKQENADVQQYFCDVLTYWIEAYKVDGYRFDLAKGMGASSSYANDYDASKYNSSRITIMKKYTDAIKAANPNAYAIYEYFVDSNEEKEMANYGGMAWKKMNYEYSQAACGYSSGSSFSSMNTAGTVGYMESHDEERLSYNVFTSPVKSSYKSISTRAKRLGAVAAFMIMNPGAKMIWQFGELGFDTSGGNGDTSEKDPVWDWLDSSVSSNKYRIGLRDSYRELMWIRRNNPDLFDAANRSNSKYFSWSVAESNWDNGRFITLRNAAGTKEMVVAMNPTASNATFSYTFDNPSGAYYINSKTYSTSPSFDASASTITVPAHSYVVISNIENPLSGIENVVEDKNNVNVTIYPNPATDYVNVKAEGVKAIEVYSMAGSLVANVNGESTLDVSGLAKGTYLVKVSTEAGVKVEKLIKK